MKKENSSLNLCDYVALHTLDALQCCMDTLQCHGGLSAAGTSGRLLPVFYPLKNVFAAFGLLLQCAIASMLRNYWQ